MKKAKHFILLFLAMIVIIVAFQNNAATETQVLFWKVSMPMTLLLFVTLVAGVVLGLFFSLLMGKKKK